MCGKNVMRDIDEVEPPVHESVHVGLSRMEFRDGCGERWKPDSMNGQDGSTKRITTVRNGGSNAAGQPVEGAEVAT